VTFAKDEVPLFDLLEIYRKKTGATMSAAVKIALKASLLEDPEASETMRLMKGFSAPVARAGRKFLMA